jgi:hypothetical protein
MNLWLISWFLLLAIKLVQSAFLAQSKFLNEQLRSLEAQYLATREKIQFNEVSCGPTVIPQFWEHLAWASLAFCSDKSWIPQWTYIRSSYGFCSLSSPLNFHDQRINRKYCSC